MTILTPQQLREVVPQNNNVLINVGLIGNGMEKNITYKTLSLLYDPKFNSEWHSITIGKVVKTPKKLTVGMIQGEMSWKTKIEIMPGDTAIFSFEEMLRIYKGHSSKYIICSGELYVFVSYDKIYAVKRNTVPIMINGYCLVEPVFYHQEVQHISKDLNLGSLVMPRSIGATKSRYGKVIRLAEPNEYYINSKGGKSYLDQDNGVNVGDIVLISKNSDIALENFGHEKFFGGRQYYRIQRRRMEMVVEINLVN